MKNNIAKRENSLFIYMMCKFVRAYIQTKDVKRAIQVVDRNDDIAINFVDLLYISNVCSSIVRTVKALTKDGNVVLDGNDVETLKCNYYVHSILKYLDSEFSFNDWVYLSKKVNFYLNPDNSKYIRDYVNGYFILRDDIYTVKDWSDHLHLRYSDVDPSIVKAFITAFYNSHCQEFKPRLFNKIADCAKACVKGTQYMKTKVTGVRYKAIITNLGYGFSLPASRFASSLNGFNDDGDYAFNINSINTRIIYNTINFLYINSFLLDDFLSKNFRYNDLSVPQLIRDTLKYALQVYVK